jgi:hypothetical protein
VLLYSAWASLRTAAVAAKSGRQDSFAARLNLRGSYPVQSGQQEYVAEHVPAGFGLCSSRERYPDCWESVRAL